MKAEVYARVVVDTNVLLSAALVPEGVPARLLDWLLAHSRLVFSSATFAELETRLWKPKFDRYVSIEQRKRLLHDLKASATWVEPDDEIAAGHWSRESADDAFIHAAQAAEAQRLITGDDDLLVLRAVAAIRIMTPRAALNEVHSQR